jgi:chaperonin cofactor prefoldin
MRYHFKDYNQNNYSGIVRDYILNRQQVRLLLKERMKAKLELKNTANSHRIYQLMNIVNQKTEFAQRALDECKETLEELWKAYEHHIDRWNYHSTVKPQYGSIEDLHNHEASAAKERILILVVKTIIDSLNEL